MRRNTLVFMIIGVVFIIAAAIVFPMSSQNGGALGNKPVKLGLDLSGGVHLVYQADLSKIPPADQNAAMDADVAVINKRVDAFGVTNSVIQRQGTDRIVVEIPGISDIDKAKATIGTTNLIEFGEQVTDSNDPAIKWKENPDKNVTGNWKPATGDLNGQQVELTSAYFKDNTYVSANNLGQIVLNFEWNSDGATLSKEITSRLVGKPLGIFNAGGELVSYPTVKEVISTGGIIEGMTKDQASSLSSLLNAGRLQVPLNPIYEQTVSPVAGANFVDLAYKAAIIALVLIILFMSIYYRLPGVLASVALIIYAVVNLAIYKMVPITLTLAGLGGFIASLGMAVDANVLIFERMKEEMRAGRTVGAAIEAGFKRAWSAIWDCNITTIIACVIMLIMGSSVVASSLITGFAITLLIGVILSMITAITVTRTFLRLFMGTSVVQKTGLFVTIGGK
jgi:preprotein translocase subunit SecD